MRQIGPSTAPALDPAENLSATVRRRSSVAVAASFWQSNRSTSKTAAAGPPPLRALVSRVMEAPGLTLFDAVEAGVPTSAVDLLATGTGKSVKDVLQWLGLSATTLRRKAEAGEPLPDAAGYRLMAFLRVAATLRRLLAESGDPQRLEAFDVEGWVSRWIGEPLAELGGKTPAEMLRNPEGQRAVEQVLERMRGGLPA